MLENVAILGAGSWGTALGIVLAHRGTQVLAYSKRDQVAYDINENHRNDTYLPGVALPEGIRCTTRLEEISNHDAILIAIPSKAARSVLEAVRDTGIPESSILINCTKGMDPASGKLMHELCAEIFPHNPFAVLSGPSHAEEAARGLATVVVAGSTDETVAVRVQDLFTVPWFRVYTSNDVVGIEVGGMVKNIFAVAAGATDGLGLGDNAKAALLTRGLAEMTRIGIALGAKEETFRGLSGVGDLIATCYSKHSRNNRLGRMLGQGMTLEEAIAATNQVAEGVPNAKNVYALSRKLGIRTPLIDQTYAVIHSKKPVMDALRALFHRDPRPEAE